MIATSSIILARKDGSKLYIEIEPVSYEDHGAVQFAGVYQLQASKYDDPIAASTEDNPGDTIDAGTFAHKDDDPFEWIYDGELLNEEEQDQLAAHIQRLNIEDSNPSEKDDEPASSFYVHAFYHGGMKSFEVTPDKYGYSVAYDGQVIAVFQRNEGWVQVSGEKLDEDVFVSVEQAIEAKQDNLS
jgi:hypothetical protein